jgi:hypothetical protein
MTQTAAMVQLKVVKAGGAGGIQDMTCAEICASFDPPIIFGPHSKMKGTLDGYQAEHIVPTSAMHQSGRGGATMTGCEGYSTPDALTWNAYDAQSTPTGEHKILTDHMPQFSQATDLGPPPGGQAPLSDWLDKYKEGAKDALTRGQVQRKTPPGLDRDSLIDAAAECIKQAAAEAFAAMDPPVAPSTPLRNPWPATNDQRAAAAAASAGNAGSGLVGV